MAGLFPRIKLCGLQGGKFPARIRTPAMGYFTTDSEQYASWNKLQDSSKKDGFTTEGLAFGAQYEALRVWEEYVKNQGSLKGKQAREVVRTIAEAWITLQVAYRNDVGIRVDYRTAQLEAKRGALDALDDAMEG